jgi:hypothetical protein
MNYKKKYLKYKLKYLTAKKILGGDGRLPNCTLSKDVLEGFKGGMEGTSPQTPEPESESESEPEPEPGSPPELTIKQKIDRYNNPKEANKKPLLIDILNYVKKKILDKLVETVEDGLKLFMIIELDFTGFNLIPPEIFKNIVGFITNRGHLHIMDEDEFIEIVVAQIKHVSEQQRIQWIENHSEDPDMQVYINLYNNTTISSYRTESDLKRSNITYEQAAKRLKFEIENEDNN